MFKIEKSVSSFSVNDLPKAKEFYEQTLGLKTTERMGILELSFNNGNKVIAYPKPNHEPATFTVLNFPVDNVEQAVDDLTAKGVRFEQYTGQLQTDEKGISRGMGGTIAWFKDPAGNIFSLMEGMG